jgi:hypothetical protein
MGLNPEQVRMSEDVNVTSGCIDSDGGIDHYPKGTEQEKLPSQGTETTVDHCLDTATLMEAYFKGNNGDAEKQSCPGGCKAGACIKKLKKIDQPQIFLGACVATR